MNRTNRDPTRIVRSWLEEGADRIPDRVLDAVQAQLPATHQRRGGWVGRTWALLSRRSVGYGIAAAVVVGAAAFGAASYAPLDSGARPTPVPTPVATPVPISEARVLPLEGGDLEPGWYTLEGFPEGIVFDVPAGLTACSGSVTEQGVCAADEGALAPAIGFLLLENVVEDPCSETLRDPPPDSLDGIVAAISSLDGFEATPAVDVSLDGVRGKKFVVTSPGGIGCQLMTWSTAERTNGVGRGEVNELTILEIDGAFVMVSIAHFPTDPPRESLALMRQIVDSIRISR